VWTGCKRDPVGCWGYSKLCNCRIYKHRSRNSPCARVCFSVFLSWLRMCLSSTVGWANLVTNTFIVFISIHSFNIDPVFGMKWPRGLRRGSAAACLLWLRVRIPTGLWMSVSSEWRVLSLRRADQLSREVLKSVAWLIVIPKPQHWGDLSPLGLSIPRKIVLKLVIYTLRIRVNNPRI
jgi:hypothetical protein